MTRSGNARGPIQPPLLPMGAKNKHPPLAHPWEHPLVPKSILGVRAMHPFGAGAEGEHDAARGGHTTVAFPLRVSMMSIRLSRRDWQDTGWRTGDAGSVWGIYRVPGGALARGDTVPMSPRSRASLGVSMRGMSAVSCIRQCLLHPQTDGKKRGWVMSDGAAEGAGRPGPTLLDHHAAREVLGEVLEELRGGAGAVGQLQLLQLLQLHQPRQPCGGQQGAACKGTMCTVTPKHQHPNKLAPQKLSCGPIPREDAREDSDCPPGYPKAVPTCCVSPAS